MFRKRFQLSWMTYLAWSCLAVAQPNWTAAQDSQTLPFYIGTYTGGISQGIYRSELRLDTGALSNPQLVAKMVNPSFLTIHPNRNVLYAVSEVGAGEGRDTTQIMAFNILPDGQLQPLGGCSAGGDAPCYVSTDQAGQFVLVANYGSGNISAIQLNADGSLGRTTSHVQHAGSSVNPQRQGAPHAHCILTDPSDQFVCAVDLGLDEVRVYRLDRVSGALIAAGKLKTDAGNGPRHLTFHPDGKHAFVIHELTSRLTSCSWDSSTGTLRSLRQYPRYRLVRPHRTQRPKCLSTQTANLCMVPIAATTALPASALRLEMAR